MFVTDLDKLCMLLVSCQGWRCWRGLRRWLTNPWCRIQSLVCSVVCNISCSAYPGYSLTCQQLPGRRSPCWLWTPPAQTIGKPDTALNYPIHFGVGLLLTMDRKKSTWGLLWTKKRTGCLSIVTLRMKSGGVPGLTLGLTTPSWWLWIRVSSRSSTSTFFLTMLSLCLEMGDRGEMSYLIALCCWTWTCLWVIVDGSNIETHHSDLFSE